MRWCQKETCEIRLSSCTRGEIDGKNGGEAIHHVIGAKIHCAKVGSAEPPRQSDVSTSVHLGKMKYNHKTKILWT